MLTWINYHGTNIMSKGKLYLLPSTLGDNNTNRSLPVYNASVISKLRFFIVENLRSARRFLRDFGYREDFSNVTFFILDKYTTPDEFHEYLIPVREGQDIGIISEAGLPCVADPGSEIVKLAHRENIQVIPLIGPSSIMLALMASGFNGQNFVFHGYLPIKNPLREKKILELEKAIYRNDQTQILIETPYRNLQMLESIIKVCMKDTQLCIAFDLTLPGETIISRPIRHWKPKLADMHKKPAVFLLYK